MIYNMFNRPLKFLILIVFLGVLSESCKKDIFSEYRVRVYYEQDGEEVSIDYVQSIFSGLAYPPHFQMVRRNDTTFFYAPIPYGIDICLIDKNNPTFPLQRKEYVYKTGPLESAIHGSDDYSEDYFPYCPDNVIVIDGNENMDEEIIDGWCSVEPVFRDNGRTKVNGSSNEFRGIKICFEATWRDMSTGKEHALKRGEALFSAGNIDIR